MPYTGYAAWINEWMVPLEGTGCCQRRDILACLNTQLSVYHVKLKLMQSNTKVWTHSKSYLNSGLSGRQIESECWDSLWWDSLDWAQPPLTLKGQLVWPQISPGTETSKLKNMRSTRHLKTVHITVLCSRQESVSGHIGCAFTASQVRSGKTTPGPQPKMEITELRDVSGPFLTGLSGAQQLKSAFCSPSAIWGWSRIRPCTFFYFLWWWNNRWVLHLMEMRWM